MTIIDTHAHIYPDAIALKAAQSTGIHPLFCDEISRQFAKRLALCSSRQQLTNMYFEMIREYCRLCSENKSNYTENTSDTTTSQKNIDYRKHKLSYVYRS